MIDEIYNCRVGDIHSDEFNKPCIPVENSLSEEQIDVFHKILDCVSDTAADEMKAAYKVGFKVTLVRKLFHGAYRVLEIVPYFRVFVNISLLPEILALSHLVKFVLLLRFLRPQHTHDDKVEYQTQQQVQDKCR